jgi:hypothetical protein
VREGRGRESPLSRLQGDDLAHSLVFLDVYLSRFLLSFSIYFSTKPTATMATLGCILLQLKSTILEW